jgi:phosphoribosylanthranilate isomerase
MTRRIKICGVTRADDARAASELGADIIGLNFYPPSPRFLDLDRARAVREAVGRRALAVGVFVNAARGFIEERIATLGLDMIQFHGDEDDTALRGWPVPVIRAIRVRAGDAARAIAGAHADFVLLDTFHDSLYGGTGVARPIDDLRGCDLSRVFISGGLNPENVGAAAALNPYAVDVASGVESAPGIKDLSKLRSFIDHARISR